MRTLVVAPAVVSVAWSVQAVAAPAPGVTLSLRTKLISEHQTRVGYTLTEQLSTAAGAPAGTSSGACLNVRKGDAEPSSASCHVELKLRDGTLDVTFVIAFATDSGRLTVTGGSGAYRDSRGKGSLANGNLKIALRSE
jgi:hypothetical protein